MLLRRVIEHVKAQNWTAVGLDFIIVVIGVFVGIQMDGWNGDRADRQLEARYLERLNDDLTDDLARLDRSASLAALRIQQIELVRDGSRDASVAAADPDRFVAAIEKAAWRSNYPIRPNVYAELVGTGRLTLLRSETLRDALASYYRTVDDEGSLLSNQVAQDNYAAAVAGLLTMSQLEIIEMNGAIDAPPVGSDPADAAALAQALAARPDAVRWLAQMHHHHVLVRETVARHRAEAADLIALIGSLHSDR